MPTRRTGSPARKAAKMRLGSSAIKREKKPQNRSQVTRETLLRTTISTIADLGYHGASVDKIVARAGLSRGAQVHHFPTKLALVEAACSYMLEGLIGDIRDHTDKIRVNEEGPEELFVYLWNKYYSDQFYAVSLEMVVAARTDQALRARLSDIVDKFHRNVDDCWYLLCRSHSSPEDRPPVPLNMTLSFLRGMGIQTVLWNRPENFSEQLTEWLRIMTGRLTMLPRAGHKPGFAG